MYLLDMLKIFHMEKKELENFYVDGFCKETNTIYEYIGCYHHGHSKPFDSEKWRKINGKN